MNYNILTNEHKIELSDNVTLTYGSQDEDTSKVITMTVKGKFKPTETLKDYTHNIRQAKESFQRHGNTILTNLDWITNHYIFTTDFTECGITKGKSCKWKFQLYVSPNETGRLENHSPHIVKLSETMTDCLEHYFETNGFKLT